MKKLDAILKLAELVNDDPKPMVDDDLIGSYVIVRCRDAGVHAGYLESYEGRQCKLRKSRRLWYWKPANGAAFLSGVAAEGIDDTSKVGCRTTVLLTENCEIIVCSDKAQMSIEAANDYTP